MAIHPTSLGASVPTTAPGPSRRGHGLPPPTNPSAAPLRPRGLPWTSALGRADPSTWRAPPATPATPATPARCPRPPLQAGAQTPLLPGAPLAAAPRGPSRRRRRPGPSDRSSSRVTFTTPLTVRESKPPKGGSCRPCCHRSVPKPRTATHLPSTSAPTLSPLFGSPSLDRPTSWLVPSSPSKQHGRRFLREALWDLPCRALSSLPLPALTTPSLRPRPLSPSQAGIFPVPGFLWRRLSAWMRHPHLGEPMSGRGQEAPLCLRGAMLHVSPPRPGPGDARWA